MRRQTTTLPPPLSTLHPSTRLHSAPSPSPSAAARHTSSHSSTLHLPSPASPRQVWFCAAACAFVAWQFVTVALAVAGVVGEAGWAAAADAAVAECTARARDAAADTAFRASWAREGVQALGSSLGGLAVSNTAAAVGAASAARAWGGEVAEAASLILLELEVRSLPKLAPPPGRTPLAAHPWPLGAGPPGSRLRYALRTSRRAARRPMARAALPP